MREMKGYKVNAPLSFTIRVRDKQMTYKWFNIIGHKTQMSNCKKTKSFVFVARPTQLDLMVTPVLTQAAMTIKTSRSMATDLWAKISSSGLFLYIMQGTTMNNSIIQGMCHLWSV